MSRKYSIAGSFKFALEGIKEALFNEPNFQVHAVLGTLAIILGIFFKLSHNEWVILLFTICFVLILELFNTAIEKIVDMVSPKFHPKAKIAKDVSAAAVLISSLLAIFVSIILFIPKLL